MHASATKRQSKKSDPDVEWDDFAVGDFESGEDDDV